MGWGRGWFRAVALQCVSRVFSTKNPCQCLKLFSFNHDKRKCYFHLYSARIQRRINRPIAHCVRILPVYRSRVSISIVLLARFTGMMRSFQDARRTIRQVASGKPFGRSRRCEIPVACVPNGTKKGRKLRPKVAKGRAESPLVAPAGAKSLSLVPAGTHFYCCRSNKKGC